jgi:hypothetical protein
MQSTGPSTPVRGESAAARSWPRALALAAAALYVPQLLPLVTTDLLEHGHCLSVYTRFFVVLSGLVAGLNARIASNVGEPGEELVLLVVAALVTLLLLGGTTVALRRWRRGGLVVALATVLASALLSMAAVALIRA